MTTDIKELAARVRKHVEHIYMRAQGIPLCDWSPMSADIVSAADALEAMAGAVERLTIKRYAEHQKYLKTYDLMGSESHRAEAAEAERDRLKAALEKIVAQSPEHSPEMGDDYGANFDDAWSGGWDSGFNSAANIARKALGGDAS